MLLAFILPTVLGREEEDDVQCSFIGAVIGGSPKIPKEYADYADVFSKEGAIALL